MSAGALERTRPILRKLVEASNLSEVEVSVLVKPLTPEEAIGVPGRRDFPILVGRERVIEARVAGSAGQAFTDAAREFIGPLAEVIGSPFDGNGARAIYTATMNATLRHLGRVTGTVHCRDDDPEICAADIAGRLRERFGEPRVGLIGLNPAIADHLVGTFGADRVGIVDLNPDNIGQQKFGVLIGDGATQTGELIAAADVVILTGTTLVNDTFDAIWEEIERRGKTGIVFGVTAAGVCELLGYERICPRALDA